MRASRLAAVAATALVTAQAASIPARTAANSDAEPLAAVEAQVRARETAFAKTIVDRDLSAFASFVSEEAVFAGRSVLRGRAAVVAGWKAHFEGPRAPFSWAAERVSALDSQTLALSSGPVYDPDGKRVGTFHSTWRRETDGQWRVVLDGGCPPCACPSSP